MATHSCEHRHTYLQHPQCYRSDRKDRVGYFDIESGGSGFTADGSFVLCYSILDDATDEITASCITPAEIRKYGDRGHEDYGVVSRMIGDLRKFDRIITYNGVNFDTKFVRTRALHMGLPFPKYGSLKHNDAYFLAKSRLSLRRKSQESVGICLFGRDKIEKNHFDVAIWRQAARGNVKALERVVDHNKRDVRDLKKIYHKLLDYGRPPADNSI